MESPIHFPLVGEPLAVDLVNTRVQSPHGELDSLSSTVALEAWLGLQATRLSRPERGLTTADLNAVRTVRAHITEAIEHARCGESPPPRALRGVTQAQRAAAAYRELRWDGARVTAIARWDGDRSTWLAAELATAAVELLASPDILQVRQCARPDCVLLFLPDTPRRRWCSATCGNRVRVARHYRRHKTEISVPSRRM